MSRRRLSVATTADGRETVPTCGRPALVLALGERVTAWRADAAVLRRRGCADKAELLEACAAELEHDLTVRATEEALLTVEEAARETGYSASGIRKQLERGAVPNRGAPYQPRIRRGDLLPLVRGVPA